MNSFRDLQVWKSAIEFTTSIYILTKTFPKNEQFSLIDQLHRATVSIPSNIAEGAQRQSHKEFVNFLYIAYGSCAEVETQLLIAKNLKYLNENSYMLEVSKLTEIEDAQ